jgi:hypothetical protein
LDHDINAPNTAKSYIDIRKNSNKSRLEQSNVK